MVSNAPPPKRDLIDHMHQRGHTSSPYVKCPKCKEKFPMMAIGPHYEECVAKKEKKTRICDTCGKEVDAWGYNRKVVVHQNIKLHY